MPGPDYLGAERLERFNLNGFSVVKCFVPSSTGGVQINYSSHIVQNGYWIDMHLSKQPTEPGDDEILKSFVQSIILRVR
jgi:hypothetical protein